MIQVEHQLKKFRVIEPSEAFRKKTLTLIFETNARKKWIFNFSWIWAPALAVLVLTVVIGGRLISSKPSLASFNPEGLKTEFETMNVNFELQELSYRQSVNQEIASALSEITDNRTRHLSPSLIEEESNSINLDDPNESEIDSLLQSIIF